MSDIRSTMSSLARFSQSLGAVLRLPDADSRDDLGLGSGSHVARPICEVFMVEREAEYCELGIDCPPGDPRPGDLLPRVLRGTGLRVSDFDLENKLFGAWTWRLKTSKSKDALFLASRGLLIKRLERLVKRGTVRGAIVRPIGPRQVLQNK